MTLMQPSTSASSQTTPAHFTQIYHIPAISQQVKLNSIRITDPSFKLYLKFQLLNMPTPAHRPHVHQEHRVLESRSAAPALYDEVKILQNKISHLQTTISNLEDNRSVLEVTIDNKQKRITYLENSNARLKDTNGKLQEDARSLKKEVMELKWKLQGWEKGYGRTGRDGRGNERKT